jgi:hypothetical protein
MSGPGDGSAAMSKRSSVASGSGRRKAARREFFESEATPTGRGRAERELKRLSAMQRMLGRLSQILAGSAAGDLEARLDAALPALGSAFAAERCSVLRAPGNRKRCALLREWRAGNAPLSGEPHERARTERRAFWETLSRDEIAIGQASAPDARRSPDPAAGDAAFLAAPLMSRGAILGALCLDRCPTAEPPGAVELAVFRTAADLIAGALSRERLDEENRRLRRELDSRVRSRTSALQASLRELESFSYAVSHDLRGPLRGIGGYSALLLNEYGGQLDETARGYLSRIRAATERMGSLIDQLLDLSRISSAPTHPTEVDLSAVASEILTELSQGDPRRRVATRIEPGMRARGDPGLLRVALGNLLGNAWKFTSVRVEAAIEFSPVDSDRGRAFCVRDNGAGFDPAYAKKLFEPFQRLHAAEQFPGNGIGLTTVKRIIDRHGGAIWAEGAADLGARFYFTLPGG